MCCAATDVTLRLRSRAADNKKIPQIRTVYAGRTCPCYTCLVFPLRHGFFLFAATLSDFRSRDTFRITNGISCASSASSGRTACRRFVRATMWLSASRLCSLLPPATDTFLGDSASGAADIFSEPCEDSRSGCRTYVCSFGGSPFDFLF